LAKVRNTLVYDADKCNLCGTCIDVCPHAVFERGDKAIVLADPDACIECGACMINCAVGAIEVDSGVGCASAMIKSALTGKEPTCGDSSGACCS
jgi:NAD-dependent dihydropyrimidine dehydrogenase PreA subunit